MKLLQLLKSNAGVDYLRLLLPHKHLALRDGETLTTITTKETLDPERFEGIDIVFFSRECPFDLDQVLALRDRFCFKLVVDVDDYWYLYKRHFYYKAWQKHGIREKMIRAFRCADMVTTTHEKLREKVLKYNDNVAIFPNAFPFGDDQFIRYPPAPGKKSLLYVGGITHFEDLNSISGALRRCGADPLIASTTRFVLAGYNNSSPETDHEWRRVADVAAQFGECKIEMYKPPSEFMSHYQLGSFCIAPLSRNSFNQHKSNLKVLESGCNALPIIVSDMHPYDVDEPEGIIFCKTQRDWYNAIRRYAQRPELIEEDGERLYQYVANHYHLREVNQQRLITYRALAKRS